MILNQWLSKAQRHLDAKNFLEALEIFKHLLPYLKDDPVFLNIFGTTYLRVNEKKKGIEILERAFVIDPKNAHILYNLGKAYIDCKDFVNAKKYFQLAIKYEPNNPLTLTYLGVVFKHFEKLDKARNLLLTALKIDSNYAYAHFYLGKISEEKKDYKSAIRSYDKAITSDPNYFAPHWNKGLLKLLMGEFEEGWKLYESRLNKKDSNYEYTIFDTRKSWRGEKEIDGKILLIYGEQGFGDVIQFSRYLLLLKSYNCELILYVKKELVSILSTIDNHITVVGMDSMIPMHDFNCPIMSLPLVFKTDLSNIPSKVPYIQISKTKKNFWQKKLDKTNHKKIGIVFSGSKNHEYDNLRSIEFDKLQTYLRDINSVEFHSLMLEYKKSDKEIIKNSSFLICHEDELHDFSDTAALISSLDLVISIDSAVAHLAGALNKPVWILLPYNPDFRWMDQVSNSLWYPSAKLFRKKDKNDWGQTLEEVNSALKDFIN